MQYFLCHDPEEPVDVKWAESFPGDIHAGIFTHEAIVQRKVPLLMSIATYRVHADFTGGELEDIANGISDIIDDFRDDPAVAEALWNLRLVCLIGRDERMTLCFRRD